MHEFPVAAEETTANLVAYSNKKYFCVITGILQFHTTSWSLVPFFKVIHNYMLFLGNLNHTEVYKE